MSEPNGQVGTAAAWAEAVGLPDLEAPGARPRAIDAALAALALGAFLFSAHVTVHLGGSGNSGLWDHWIYDGVIGGAAAICLLRGRAGRDRGAWALIGGALCIYWLGDMYWNNELSSLAEPPYPSWADAGWLLYYLPLYVGMMMLLRGRLARLPVSTWLEGLVGALALAAVAATVVFDPIVASTHGSVSTVLTNLAYPTFDVLLVAMVAGVLTVLGRQAGPAWMLLGVGLLTAGLADSVYLFQAASGTYSESGWVNAGWPLAFTTRSSRRRTMPSPERRSASSEASSRRWRSACSSTATSVPSRRSLTCC